MNAGFAELFVAQCAPTLAGLKPANLYRYEPAPGEKALAMAHGMDAALRRSGIRVRVLKECARTGALLIYTYRVSAMRRILADGRNTAFLSRHGLLAAAGPGGSTGEEIPAAGTAGDPAELLPGILDRLSERLCAEREFPHEIGLLLGYPLDDVVGFIEHRGQACEASCYWKTYTDPELAKRSEERYRKCSKVYRDCFLRGVPFPRLIVAA